MHRLGIASLFKNTSAWKQSRGNKCGSNYSGIIKIEKIIDGTINVEPMSDGTINMEAMSDGTKT